MQDGSRMQRMHPSGSCCCTIYVSATHNRSAFEAEVLRQRQPQNCKWSCQWMQLVSAFFFFLSSFSLDFFLQLVLYIFFFYIYLRFSLDRTLVVGRSVYRSLGRHQCSSQRHKLGSIKRSTHIHSETERQRERGRHR